MDPAEIIRLLTDDPVAQQLVNSPIPARVAYVATDGTPRVVPLVHHFDGRHFVVATPAGAPKVSAMEANPAVALTIDTEGDPPQALLVRGTVSITIVDGAVPEFVLANQRRMPGASYEQLDQEPSKVFPRMARIEITPTWAKVLDETRPPRSHQTQ